MEFKSIVVTIVILVLIVALVFIGIALSKGTKDKQWPPVVPTCPDYWKIGNDGKCANDNETNLGRCPDQRSVDFTKAPYVGNAGSCQKYKWATGCGVAWDGITYGVKNPCD